MATGQRHTAYTPSEGDRVEAKFSLTAEFTEALVWEWIVEAMANGRAGHLLNPGDTNSCESANFQASSDARACARRLLETASRRFVPTRTVTPRAQ